jgi:hypothetical protein
MTAGPLSGDFPEPQGIRTSCDHQVSPFKEPNRCACGGESTQAAQRRAVELNPNFAAPHG